MAQHRNKCLGFSLNLDQDVVMLFFMANGTKSIAGVNPLNILRLRIVVQKPTLSWTCRMFLGLGFKRARHGAVVETPQKRICTNTF